MSKLKLFLENFLVYGLGGVISKIIPLIMIPIVTRLMPSTNYFGISDLSNTIVQFGSAIAIMGMYDAMYRMFFESNDEKYQKKVCSTAFLFTLVTSVIIFFIMVMIRDVIAQAFFNDKQYAYVVYISALATLVGATNSIVSAPTRMQNKKKIFLITNTVSPLLSYSISIPMLLSGYYVIALPLAAVISGLTMEITFWVLNHYWFSFKLFDKNLLKQLLVIGIPLLPNTLIYWVFNSSDRVMITNMIGIGEAGIYSVGAKFGHLSQLIYTAFAGGWQFFAFSTMKDKNQVEVNSKIFEYLGVISYIATVFICALSFSVFKLLFSEQYLPGYIIVPYLFLAPLLQMLFQVAGNQFLVIKKTWPNMLVLMVGAIINIILNWMLIPAIGIEGAAMATLVGYVISDIICVYVLQKMELMAIRPQFLEVTIFAMLFVVLWRIFFTKNLLIGLIMSVFFTIVVVLIYKQDFLLVCSKLKKNR